MLINGAVTIYHKVYDELLRIEKWKRYNYSNAWIFNKENVTINQGFTNANTIEVRIWYDINKNLNIKNFSMGDIIVKGQITKDIETQQDLSDYKIYNITSITDNIFGGATHIHLGGQ